MPPKQKQQQQKAKNKAAKPDRPRQDVDSIKSVSDRKKTDVSSDVPLEQGTGERGDAGPVLEGDISAEEKGLRWSSLSFPPPPDYCFELFLLLFVGVHLLLQNYNLNSWNLHSYNIPHIAFTLVFFTKRVAWKFLHSSWNNNNQKLTFGLAVRVALWVAPSLCLIKASIDLLEQHGLTTFLFLLYPYFLYYSLFGGTAPINWIRCIEKSNAQSVRKKRAAIMLCFRHSVKEILYYSIESGYYAAMLPARFLLNRHAVYDQSGCMLLWLYVTVNTGMLLTSHLVSASWEDLHRQAKTLGCWKSLSVSTKPKGIEEWSEHQQYDRIVVKYKKQLYISKGEPRTTAEPGDRLSWLFYNSFKNPQSMATGMIFFQVGVAASQIGCLMLATRWEAVMAWGVMIIFSYAVLLRTLAVRRKVIDKQDGAT